MWGCDDDKETVKSLRFQNVFDIVWEKTPSGVADAKPGHPATGNNNTRARSTRTSALLRRNQKYVVFQPGLLLDFFIS